MKSRPHKDLQCTCDACMEWDAVVFAECPCLCGDCKVKFVNEMKAQGKTLDALKPETP